MQNAALMRMVNGAGNFGDEGGRFPEIIASRCGRFLTLSSAATRWHLGVCEDTIDAVSQISPRNKLHREVRMAFNFAYLIDRNYIRVFQAGDRFGFGAKALHLGFP